MISLKRKKQDTLDETVREFLDMYKTLSPNGQNLVNDIIDSSKGGKSRNKETRYLFLKMAELGYIGHNDPTLIQDINILNFYQLNDGENVRPIITEVIAGDNGLILCINHIAQNNIEYLMKFLEIK